MDKLNLFVPNLVIVLACVLLAYNPSYGAVATLAVGSVLWGFHFYVSRPLPEPPRTDEARFTLLEHELAETKKQLDSVKTAVNMRQLR